MTPPDTVLLVLTTLPDREAAEALAEALVTERVAACANVLAPCTSVYRWKGALERAGEVPVMLKTVASRFEALRAAVRARHPYELPEIIALPVSLGDADYLRWVAEETGAMP